MKIINDNILDKVIKSRPIESHKGTFGRVLIIGGDFNMGGAAILSGSAAVHAGAGLVTIATDKTNFTAIHSVVPEAMVTDYSDESSFLSSFAKSNVIVVGPGLGLSEFSVDLIKTIFSNLKENQILIIDGSAITLIAQNKDLQAALPHLNIIFTPHQMEWQRLSGIQINEQTLVKNQQVQEKLDATVILKKHHTEIYFKNQNVMQLNIGGPAMATGGMGDTLTGILAAFLAQFKQTTMNENVQAAVYIHSKIADELAKKKYVVLPSDIIANLQEYMVKKCLN